MLRESREDSEREQEKYTYQDSLRKWADGGYQRSSASCPVLSGIRLKFVQAPKGPTGSNTCCSAMDISINNRLKYEHLATSTAHPMNEQFSAPSHIGFFALNLIIVPYRFTLLIAIYPRVYKVVRMINEGIYTGSARSRFI